MNKYLKIAIFVVSCLAIGYLSGLVTREAIPTWYATLVKPSFNPPNWVFAPVWSSLYLAMGVAAGLAWSRMDYEPVAVKKALRFFWIQLGLNALWSILFFGLHNPLLALLEIVLLWLMIYETWTQFRHIHKIAGYLLVPYLLWVSFASALNASIWWLNR